MAVRLAAVQALLGRVLRAPAHDGLAAVLEPAPARDARPTLTRMTPRYR